MERSASGAEPRLVLTVGLHGSASTWVFNVARELLEASCGAETVAVCHATEAADVAAARQAGRHLVAKTHGWPGVAAFARDQGAAVIVSVRDPRDAALSLMQRFGDSLDVAVGGVGRDCGCASACAAAGHPVLRYEDGFFDDPATLRRIAAHLGVTPGAAVLDAIFARWRTDAVRARAAAVPTLPPEQRSPDGAPVMLERRTLVTRTHIGDGRSGKWREAFDAEPGGRMTRFFAPFLIRFGYPFG